MSTNARRNVECGAADYTDLASLGFPNVHIIQRLGTGSTDPCQVPLHNCRADVAPVAGNGVVDIDDLLAVINNWGATGANPADVNHDNVVNIDDLLAVIGAWGPCP